MTVRALINELNRLTKLYDEGCPEVSDKEWDDLYFELVNLERATGEYYPDSPTQKIYYEIKNELKKVEHNHPMLSLDKTKSIEDIKSFIGNKDYIVMAKMDGLTCSLTYENGRLVKAETRGNGLIGEDITHNAIVVKNIPKKINYKNELIVDGEIICTNKDFEEFKDEYKNSRNFASGSIRLLDSKESEKRKLSFIAWDVIKGLEDNEFLITRLNELQNLGFEVVSARAWSAKNIDYVEKAIEDIKESCKAYGWPIDGIVFKYDKVKEYLDQGYYLVLQVKCDGTEEPGQHWVAVLGVTNSGIVMSDPASDKTNVWDKYKSGGTVQFHYYKKLD